MKHLAGGGISQAGIADEADTLARSCWSVAARLPVAMVSMYTPGPDDARRFATGPSAPVGATSSTSPLFVKRKNVLRNPAPGGSSMGVVDAEDVLEVSD
ncbi:MAG: hypothetical protein ACSLFM_06330 [Tepidiformaceae bacterium]